MTLLCPSEYMSELAIAAAFTCQSSAIASGTEAALFAIPKSKVASLLIKAGQKQRLYWRLKKTWKCPSWYAISSFSTMFPNIVVNTVGALRRPILEVTVGPISLIGVFSAALTFAVITFSEIIPKTIGERKHEVIALWSAPMVLLGSKVLLPAIICIELITDPIPRFVKSGTHVTSEAEILALSEIGSQTVRLSKTSLK